MKGKEKRNAHSNRPRRTPASKKPCRISRVVDALDGELGRAVHVRCDGGEEGGAG